VYLDKIRAAGFGKVEIASRPYQPAGLDMDNEQVQPVKADGPVEMQEAKTVLTKAEITLDELAKMVASVNVTAFKPG
jgi:hypothetical protein